MFAHKIRTSPFAAVWLAVTILALAFSIKQASAALSIAPTVSDGNYTAKFGTTLAIAPDWMVDGAWDDIRIKTPPSIGTVGFERNALFYHPGYEHSGTDRFTFTALNNGVESAEATVTITIEPSQLTISPAKLPDGKVGQSYNARLTAQGGSGSYRFFDGVSGYFPRGITRFDDGWIGGIPEESGTFSLVANVRDLATDAVGAQRLTITIQPADADLVVRDGQIIVGFQSSIERQLTAFVDGEVSDFQIVQQPSYGNLALLAGGLFGYSPFSDFHGTDSFRFKAISPTGQSGEGTITITVPPPPPPTLSSRSFEVPFNTSLIIDLNTFVSGALGRVDYVIENGTSNGLVLIDPFGKLSYTPNRGFAGQDRAVISAMHFGVRSAPATLAFNVAPPTVSVTSPTIPEMFVGEDVSHSFTASGGKAPYSFRTQGNIPAGLALQGGTLFGKPAAEGNFDFEIVAVDADGFEGRMPVKLSVSRRQINFQSATLTSGKYGQFYDTRLPQASGGIGNISYEFHGVAPSGMILVLKTLQLVGVPQNAGTFTLAVTAKDEVGTTTTANFTLQIENSAMELTPVQLSQPVPGVRYQQKFVATGGVEPYRYSVSGSLPTGLVLNGNILEGVPAAGRYVFTISAMDANGESVSLAYDIQIDQPEIIFPATNLPKAKAGHYYEARINAANGGNAPYTYSLNGPLPEGLLFDPQSLMISGMPDGAGNFAFKISVKDSTINGDPVEQTFKLIIEKPDAPKAADAKFPVTSGGTASLDLAKYVTGNFDSIEIADAPAKGKATLKGTILTYVAAQDTYGSDVFSYRASGPGGESSGRVIIEIAAPPVPEAIDHTVMLEHGRTGTVDVSDGAKGGPFTTAAIVAGLDGGNATVSGTRVSFVPDPGFSGSAIVKYTLANSFGTSAVRTITFLVAARPDIADDQEVIGVLTAQVQSTRRMARDQISNFASRMEKLHNEGEGTRQNELGGVRLGFASEKDDQLNLSDPFYKIDKGSGLSLNDFGELGHTAFNNKIAIWSGGYVNFGDFNADETAISSTTVGISGGIDYRFSKSFVAGLGFGFGRDKSDVGTEGSENEAKSISAAIYGSYHPASGIFIDGLAGYSWLDFSSRRFVTPTGEYAIGDRQGGQFFGSVTAGYEFRMHKLLMSPYVRVEGAHAKLDAFVEQDGGPYAISYGAQTVSSLAGVLGGRIEYEFDMSFATVKPSGRIEYTRDFDGKSRVNAGYADLGGLPSFIDIDGSDNDRLTLGLGLDTSFDNGWSLGVDYRYSTSNSEKNHGIGTRIRSTF